MDQERPAVLILIRKTGHIGITDDIGAVFVGAVVRNRYPDFMQGCRPAQKMHVIFMLGLLDPDQLQKPCAQPVVWLAPRR